MSSFCYWSVADNQYNKMLQTCIKSCRKVGVTEPFYAVTNEDYSFEGATCINIGDFSKEHYLFKFRILAEEIIKLDYDYYIFLDADCYFVRKPRDILGLMNFSPVHSNLESDLTSPDCIRNNWWGCPNEKYVEMMRNKGVMSKSIYNVNAGFFIVKRSIVSTFFSLAMDYWNYANTKGYTFTEEPPLSYVTHMLNPIIENKLQIKNRDVWASDWTGVFSGQLPTDKYWDFEDYMTQEKYTVGPAIVHAMRSKEIMIEKNGEI